MASKRSSAAVGLRSTWSKGRRRKSKQFERAIMLRCGFCILSFLWTAPLSQAGEPRPVDFRTDVIAALSRAGCSQGACHGSPQGKNGFRLSLRGYDPDLDIQTLTRGDLGR